MNVKDVIGKQFILKCVTEEPDYRKEAVLVFTLCADHMLTYVDAHGKSGSIRIYKDEEILERIDSGDWLLLANEEQIRWLQEIQIYDDFEIQKNLIHEILNKRLFPYYTLEERKILNNMRTWAKTNSL